MSKLVWDQVGEKKYEAGVDRGVLFVRDDTGKYGAGVPWNGLISVTEGVSGGEANPFYADNVKYANVLSNEEFNPAIEAYTYPDEFEACDGSKSIGDGVIIGQQKRATFGLSYRTLVGNDVADTDYGYKIHLVYGILANPSEKSRQTINESVDLMTMSWDCTTTPVPVNIAGCKPTAHVVIDSTKTTPENMAKIEALIYGSEDKEASLPMPEEIITLVGAAG